MEEFKIYDETKQPKGIRLETLKELTINEQLRSYIQNGKLSFVESEKEELELRKIDKEVYIKVEFTDKKGKKETKYFKIDYRK